MGIPGALADPTSDIITREIKVTALEQGGNDSYSPSSLNLEGILDDVEITVLEQGNAERNGICKGGSPVATQGEPPALTIAYPLLECPHCSEAFHSRDLQGL